MKNVDLVLLSYLLLLIIGSAVCQQGSHNIYENDQVDSSSIFKNNKQTFDKNQMLKLKNKVKEMFYHAYDNYIFNAYPYDELKPISCQGFDTWGSYSLTLIDSLDMLILLGNRTEFERALALLLNSVDLNKDINVSVFETNIRVIGGLLSAHLLSYKLYFDEETDELDVSGKLDPRWPCDGPLLRLAVQTAEKIMPAFNTSTGMPYGTVNLRYGVPKGETPETCVAGVGTFIVEFASLSRLTGDPKYEQTAMRAMEALWNRRSFINLVGNHINVQSGKWTAADSTIGSGVDSYFEYLVKGGILLNKPELVKQFHAYERAIKKYLSHDDWFLWSNMNKGHKTLPLFSSLDAFYPGMLTLTGSLEQAIKTAKKYHEIWRQFGSLPEFYNIQNKNIHSNRDAYPLRPELIESIMYILRATKYDTAFLEMAMDYLVSIEQISRVKCGFATVKNVRDHRLENRMESFFLAETLKYLYLIFDHENFLHNDLSSSKYKLIRSEMGECTIGTGFYIFNTEAHPIDGACLECCRTLHENLKNQQLEQTAAENLAATAAAESFNSKLLKRYARLQLSSDISPTLANGHNFELKSLDDEMQELKISLTSERERANDKLNEFCFHVANLNETQASMFKLIDEDQEALLFGHNYPFRCSLNNTFLLRVNNLYSPSYFP